MFNHVQHHFPQPLHLFPISTVDHRIEVASHPAQAVSDDRPNPPACPGRDAGLPWPPLSASSPVLRHTVATQTTHDGGELGGVERRGAQVDGSGSEDDRRSGDDQIVGSNACNTRGLSGYEDRGGIRQAQGMGNRRVDGRSNRATEGRTAQATGIRGHQDKSETSRRGVGRGGGGGNTRMGGEETVGVSLVTPSKRPAPRGTPATNSRVLVRRRSSANGWGSQLHDTDRSRLMNGACGKADRRATSPSSLTRSGPSTASADDTRSPNPANEVTRAERPSRFPKKVHSTHPSPRRPGNQKSVSCSPSRREELRVTSSKNARVASGSRPSERNEQNHIRRTGKRMAGEGKARPKNNGTRRPGSEPGARTRGVKPKAPTSGTGPSPRVGVGKPKTCSNKVGKSSAKVRGRPAASVATATSAPPPLGRRQSRARTAREPGLATELRTIWSKVNQHPSIWVFRYERSFLGWDSRALSARIIFFTSFE